MIQIENVRNILLVLTSLGAFLIPILKHSYSSFYEEIISKYTIAVKEPTKKDAVYSIIVLVIIGLYIFIGYAIFNQDTSVNSPTNASQHMDSIINAVISVILLFIMLYPRYQIKKNLINIIKGVDVKGMMFTKIILIISPFIIVITMILSFAMILNDNNQISVDKEFILYKDGRKILNSYTNEEVENSKNISIKVNDIKIAESKGQDSGVNGYIFVNKGEKIILKSVENIEFSRKDDIKICLDEKPIYNRKYKVIRGESLFDIVFLVGVVLVCYILNSLNCGTLKVLNRISNLKTQLIYTSSYNIVGKIIFKQNDFYIIYHDDKISNILKSEIKGIDIIGSEGPSKPNKVKAIFYKVKHNLAYKFNN